MSFVPQYSDYISQVQLPSHPGKTFHIKDSEAREWIEQIASAGIKFTIAWKGDSTPDVTKIPLGVTVTYQGTDYTGTLVASEETAPFIFLVYKKTTSGGRKIYEEYVTITEGTEEPYTYFWEELGDTDISIDDLGALAFKDNVVLNKSTDVVLGEATTFTNSSSAVTFSGGTDDTFVKSYPGSSSKLATTSIKGVGSDITFNAVNTATDYTATNTVFGTDTEASKITTSAKTATKLVLGTATTASKATAGTAKTFATRDASATAVSRIGLSTGSTSILESATVSGETLTFGTASVTQSSVTGTSGTDTITPYSFTNVTVPVVTSNDEVSFNAVGSVTDVVVPVVTSNTAVTTTKVTTASKTAATSAANATTVATGKVSATDTSGDSVLIGLGTAVTGDAITSIGTGTAAAQTITVGSNDLVTTLTNNTTVTVE